MLQRLDKVLHVSTAILVVPRPGATNYNDAAAAQ